MTNETNFVQNRQAGSTVHPKEVELQGYMDALQIERRMNKLENGAEQGQEQSPTTEDNE